MLKALHSSHKTAIGVLLALLLISCTLVGSYNAKSMEHVTALKAAHLKFIEVFTEGPDKAYEAKRFSEEADRIDLKFREALEFSKGLRDKFRVANIQLLKEIFEEDLANMKSKARLLTEIEAKTLAEPSALAYDRVIKGECARPEADCK